MCAKFNNCILCLKSCSPKKFHYRSAIDIFDWYQCHLQPVGILIELNRYHFLLDHHQYCGCLQALFYLPVLCFYFFQTLKLHFSVQNSLIYHHLWCYIFKLMMVHIYRLSCCCPKISLLLFSMAFRIYWLFAFIFALSLTEMAFQTYYLLFVWLIQLFPSFFHR